ncbi:MAG TPA: tRNA (adenosine(37)-N6)-dimethylallyltransferase MiaA [Opitutae bacterium]|nr:tRNA (adenosine(37)-N6)-dimethylallyltransferase MiaA [Opitutae bacterium]
MDAARNYLPSVFTYMQITIITGPTAVGKTAYTLDLAEKERAEIISCDSLAVYQGMDIGTAKPTFEEQARVRHHLIDCVPVSQPFSVKVFVERAQRAVADIVARGKNVVVAGGSGFYLKSFWAPVVDDYPKNAAVVAAIRQLEAKEGLDGLLKNLIAANHGDPVNLDTRNPARVRKALERCLTSGKPLRVLQAEFLQQEPPFNDFSKKIILLKRPPLDLVSRIAQRVDNMIDAGLVDEVKRLIEMGIDQNPSAASSIGYRETLAHLRNGGTLDDLRQAIVVNTQKLVKKQHTWFRHQLPEHSELWL